MESSVSARSTGMAALTPGRVYFTVECLDEDTRLPTITVTFRGQLPTHRLKRLHTV